jgi:hypothetical protein
MNERPGTIYQRSGFPNDPGVREKFIPTAPSVPDGLPIDDDTNYRPWLPSTTSPITIPDLQATAAEYTDSFFSDEPSDPSESDVDTLDPELDPIAAPDRLRLSETASVPPAPPRQPATLIGRLRKALGF